MMNFKMSKTKNLFLLTIALLSTWMPNAKGECTNGNIRLTGGSNDNEGRVEVCVLGQWGTVCDDVWSQQNAKIACNQLGIEGAVIAHSFGYFGAGTGPIHMDNVDCVGYESSLFNCSFMTDHNCNHFEDAGVTCGLPIQCEDGAIQLVGGEDDTEGRVEVCVLGIWGTVCDDLWGFNDATVACKQLGLEYTGAVAYRSAYFGLGSDPIVLNNVACTGNESSLFDCVYSPAHNCVHFEDAGVSCGNASCNNSGVRLVNGFTDYEGRVEVCLNGVWGTVCDDFWSTNDAVVVCNQLNISSAGAIALGSAYFGPGTSVIIMDNVFCSGTEEQLTDCTFSETHNCAHSEDASVICVDTQSNCTDGEVRLIGGQNYTEGRVELCVSGEWGTICDDLWGNSEAEVVCAQLGFDSEGAIGVGSATYGQGVGVIHIDDVQCDGDEIDLFACSYTTKHNCIHAEDAGVQCAGQGNECTHGDVNLIGGSNYTEGRVEVCINGYWGIVCDDSWTYQDAQVVCKQLGYPYEGAVALSFGHFGVGSGRINMDDVQCTGDEDALINCTYNSEHSCIHVEAAGVQCLESECDEESIRLVGGSNETEGRVEVCLGGRWGTVCDDLWGVTDAKVVCRQLGYPYTGAVAYSFAYYGQGNGPILLDNLQCSGNEISLFDCSYDPDISDCTHFEDAGVMCLESINECNHTDIRLLGGNNYTEGRVEVCLDGVWGTVCDDFWTLPDAIVVCNQLEYPTGGVQALKQAYFGQGSGPIHIDDVLCDGNETSLLDCDYEPDHNCVHSEDAGVVCGEAQCTEGDVRLVDGSTIYEGRVEVCYSGVWGTVCDDFWGTLDATVVCNQLGFSTEGALAFSQAYFGAGSGPIHIDDVQCGGRESNLLQCNFNPTHNCFHSEDSGVQCQSLVTPTAVPLVPGKIQNLALRRVNTTAVNITWNPPDSTAYIQSYEVLLQHRNGTQLDNVNLPAGSDLTYYLATNLVPYIPYTVFVSAINTDFVSGAAVSQDFFVQEGVPSVPPRNVTVTRINSTAIRVTWMKLSLEDARGIIVGYFISYQTVDSRTVSNTTTSYNVSSVVISGLKIGEKYGVTVACETEAGAGPASDIVYEPVDSRTVSNTTTSCNVSSVVISGLTVGEMYGVTVACETEAGAGPASDIVYEPGVTQQTSSGSNAGYVVAAVIMILSFIGIILLIGVNMAIIITRKRYRKKFAPLVSVGFQTDQEMLFYRSTNTLVNEQEDVFDIGSLETRKEQTESIPEEPRYVTSIQLTSQDQHDTPGVSTYSKLVESTDI